MNDAEARAKCIIECARTTYFDISTARLPHAEYDIITQEQGSYIPRDARMRRNMEINPRRYDLLEYFNPRLPPDAYSSETLHILVANQHLGGVESHYTRLMRAVTQPSFYVGKHPTIRNTETPFLSEVVSELDSDDVICFGVLYEELTAFTYKEITETLRHQRRFKLLDHELTTQMVDTLINICGRIDTDDSTDTVREINIVRMRNSQRMAVLRELSIEYEEGTDEVKANFANALNAMLRMAMFMRGWDGESEHPISRAPVRGRIDTELATTQAIAQFEEAIEKLGDNADLFRYGPLVLYDDGIEVSRIYTIGSRLDIVKLGDGVTGVDSCIRISSNWFAATAWYYCQMFRLPPPFDISSLVYTS